MSRNSRRMSKAWAALYADPYMDDDALRTLNATTGIYLVTLKAMRERVQREWVEGRMPDRGPEF